MLGVGVGVSPHLHRRSASVAPSNTVAPVITGTPTQNLSLSRSTYGTWANGVINYAIQWFSNSVNSISGGSAITGETGDTYLQGSAVVGKYIYLQVTASNDGGSASAFSNIIGPVAASGGLATPTLTNFSTLGTAPVTLMMSTTDYVAGLRGELQIATDSGFTSISQDIVFFIDGDSWARLDESIGLADPSGTYYARVRILRDNESGTTTVTDALGQTFNADASSWSTTFTDTIGGSVAILSSATGTSKSKFVNVATPFYQAVANANVGAFDGSRASIHAANTKFHFEWTLNTFAATGGNSKIYCSFDDGTTDLNAGGTGFISTFPGASGGPNGFTIQIPKGGTTPNFSRNGATSSIALPSAATDGDTLAADIDTSAKTILLTWYHAGTATVLNSGSPFTLTSQIPANWYAIVACGSGNGTVGTGSSDAATINPGNATNLVTPQTGYGIYG
jgi:hypothetical protein